MWKYLVVAAALICTIGCTLGPDHYQKTVTVISVSPNSINYAADEGKIYTIHLNAAPDFTTIVHACDKIELAYFCDAIDCEFEWLKVLIKAS